MEDLVREVEKEYKDNFPMETCFERAIFFSWGCSIRDCAFCYMSTQPKEKESRKARRSMESILAECILTKKLGWGIGFLTGGIGAFNTDEVEELLKKVCGIIGENVWLSLGPLSKELMERYSSYIKGVVGSIETINPELHKRICPSKPVLPYEKMFEKADELGLKKAMTIILGVGETRDDFRLLSSFIEKHGIDKIHVYSLIPQKGTVFEGASIPSGKEQAWWIAKLRISFPKLDIQCGIWEDRLERVSYLLKAGANSISKFKALKLFGTEKAKEIERQAKIAGREFRGSLTKLPEVDWDYEVDKLPFDDCLKDKIRKKLEIYLKQMRKNLN